jgi:hypothetical protein
MEGAFEVLYHPGTYIYTVSDLGVWTVHLFIHGRVQADMEEDVEVLSRPEFGVSLILGLHSRCKGYR